MSQIVLRPDLKTAGGEVNDIIHDGRFVGSVTLVYREGDRICGSVQLDKETLSFSQKKRVIRHVQDYVQSMVDAVEAMDCDVMVTYGQYDHVIATSREIEEDIEDEFLMDQEPYAYYDEVVNTEDETRFDDVDPNDSDELVMENQNFREQMYELVIVGESRNRIEYHVYTPNMEWVAEAFMRIQGDDVTGDITFMSEPTEDEIEAITDLIVSDFDEDEVDTFNFHMKFDGEIIETIELTHEDLVEEDTLAMLEDDDEYEEELDVFPGKGSDYSVIMVRDDEDTLTYEVYDQKHGGLPIGTATVDIATRQVTGFIDLRDRGATPDRELIASLLMQEIDKERDYDTFNLTVMCNNRPVDEMMFEMEAVH
ncbi:hypothetical protein [Paenibacillus turpanensis]|uniref:hypothetical protein n=1 Tax=Paenibacillus turpanensis TaxID=2689078 RepID=UPI00140DF419|nr:hypothetical protein [Paenibacillus turpanensis]